MGHLGPPRHPNRSIQARAELIVGHFWTERHLPCVNEASTQRSTIPGGIQMRNRRAIVLLLILGAGPTRLCHRLPSERPQRRRCVGRCGSRHCTGSFGDPRGGVPAASHLDHAHYQQFTCDSGHALTGSH